MNVFVLLIEAMYKFIFSSIVIKASYRVSYCELPSMAAALKHVLRVGETHPGK